MPKKFAPEFRRDVVTVARWGDLTVKEVTADFDVSVESVRRWMRQADVDDGVRNGQTTAEQSELVQRAVRAPHLPRTRPRSHTPLAWRSVEISVSLQMPTPGEEAIGYVTPGARPCRRASRMAPRGRDARRRVVHYQPDP